MWIACGIISVIFCAASWTMAAKNNRKALWASVCSLVFVSVTLLMEYRMVVNWVKQADWSALLDVAPSMYTMLTGYVIIMLIANGISIMAVWDHKSS